MEILADYPVPQRRQKSVDQNLEVAQSWRKRNVYGLHMVGTPLPPEAHIACCRQIMTACESAV